MKQEPKIIKCANCNTSFKTYITVSSFDFDRFLDGKPIGGRPVKDVLCCPSCHYAGFDIEQHISDDKKSVINSEAYIHIFDDSTDIGSDFSEARYEGALMLCSGDYERIGILQRYIWDMEGAGVDNKKIAEKREDLIAVLERCLNVSPDIDTTIAYIDNLRQAKHFSIAEGIVDEFLVKFNSDEIKKELFYKIIAKEKEYISMEDYSPHKVSEVKN